MRSLVLYSLILSSSIILRIKCDDVETTSITPESASNASDTDTEVFMFILNNNNDTENDANDTASNSTISLGEPFGLIIETRSKRDSTNESSATSTIDSTINKTQEGVKDDSDVNQTSTRFEESIREMFLEPWGRAKRDTLEEDASVPNSSDAPLPDNSSESIQDQNLNEFASDHDVTVEGNSASDESSSTSEEDREERDVGQSEENLEEGEYRYRTHPYWYRQPIVRRYWASQERKPSRDFIKIPIFPGK
nr:PREDICTED: uncharacterized protein LOC105662157 [Megachile rotundata]XP_012138031.1 PREDICTED: uncharacterized protein LOC105662157 [Megachile rotundata]